jgi:hypothetical protein
METVVRIAVLVYFLQKGLNSLHNDIYLIFPRHFMLKTREVIINDTTVLRTIMRISDQHLLSYFL